MEFMGPQLKEGLTLFLLVYDRKDTLRATFKGRGYGVDW